MKKQMYGEVSLIVVIDGVNVTIDKKRYSNKFERKNIIAAFMERISISTKICFYEIRPFLS